MIGSLAPFVTTAFATRLIDRCAASLVLNPALETQGVGLPLSTMVHEDTLVRLSREADFLAVFPYPPKRVYGTVIKSARIDLPEGFGRTSVWRPEIRLRSVSRTEFARRFVAMDKAGFFYSYRDFDGVGLHGGPDRTVRLERKPSARPQALARIILRYPLVEGLMMGSLSAFAFAMASGDPPALAPLLGALSGMAAVTASRKVPNPLLGILLAVGAGLATQELLSRFMDWIF